MKIKLVRVITAHYVVPWHLKNTLERITKDFDVCVVGQDVSKYEDIYPDIKFIDIDIDRKTSLRLDFFALIALCRFLLAYKPDMIHSIMPKAGLLSAIAGFICRVPIRIHTFTGQTWVARDGVSRHFYYWLDWLINVLNTLCLTDSPSQSDFLFKNKISKSGQPLPVLLRGSLSGVDVSRFNLSIHAESANRLRSNLKLDKKNFVFAFIARKTSAKGAIDMLMAFSSVLEFFEDARLLFVGPDEDGEIERLRKSNPKLFVNVIDIGHVNNHEEYLAITDVLCLPSYREGFGSIIIDAAAMGVPAIGSRIPGLTDSIVDRQTGVLFAPGDLRALVMAMLEFVENPQMRQTMGVSAKARVAEFFSADRLYFEQKKIYLRCAFKNYIIRKKL